MELYHNSSLKKEISTINNSTDYNYKFCINSGNVIDIEHTTYNTLQELRNEVLDENREYLIIDSAITDKLLTVTISDNYKGFDISVNMIEYGQTVDFSIDFYALDAYKNFEEFEYFTSLQIESVDYKPFGTSASKGGK